jgi:hypothetical protein
MAHCPVRATPHVPIHSLFHLSDLRTCCAIVAWFANICIFPDNPQEDPNIRGDAFKTIIVARLAYDATEQDLESEFGRFGPIERVCLQLPIRWFNLTGLQIRVVVDSKQHEKPNKKKKKHRGYAFIVYEREKDMRGNTIILPLPRFTSRKENVSHLSRYGPQAACLFPIHCPTQGIFRMGK